MHGPWDPSRGLRCNPRQAAAGPLRQGRGGRDDWDESLFSYKLGDETARTTKNSAPHMMKAVVINPFFDWEGSRTPTRRTSP
ncbi:hypothetical protein QJS66_20655 [Kocuria rhizophila]|nr:hypothetical protein QJS66_20655 [Kocuria rhizophila]